MPTVPTSRAAGVAPAVGPDARFQSPQVAVPDAQLNTSLLGTPQFSAPPRLELEGYQHTDMDPALARPALRQPESDAAAEIQAQEAANMRSASQQIATAALDMQTKVNASVVDDALNSARDEAARLTFGRKDPQSGQVVGGYRNLHGYDAIKRPDDKSLDDEVVNNFNDAVRQIAATKLSNADQRRAFGMQVNDVSSQLRQGALTHQAEEFDRYYQGVYTSQVSNLTTQFASLDPGDLDAQKKTMGQIEQAVGTLAVHNGASAQELDVGTRAARSAAVNGLFEQAVGAKKYATAQALLNTWAGQIDPNVAAKMKSALDGHVAIMAGEQIADEAWGHWGAPVVNTGDADRAFNIAVGTESRGNQTDSTGKVLTSPKGAKGVAQLIDGTAEATAKAVGHPQLADLAKQPTPQGRAANLLLGRAYFNQLVSQFNGDVAKAYAGYNAGPGRVSGGWKDAGGVHHEGAVQLAARLGGDWRQYLPKETQDYVKKNMTAYGAGDGTPAMPTREQLMDVVDRRTDDPDIRRAAYAKLDRHFSAHEADERDAAETAYAEGLRVVRTSGGNINAISPELESKIKPENFVTLQSYAKSMTEGATQTTDPAAYYTVMDPTVLRKMNVNQFEAMRPHLSKEDYETARRLFMDVHAPQPGKGPDSLDVSTLDSLLETRLGYMGINPKPGPKDAQGVSRVAAIKQFAHQYVLDMQRQSGNKIVDYADMEKVVNQLFTRNQAFRMTFMGVPTGDGKMNVMTAKPSDIPAQTHDAIVKQLKAAGIDKPSDAQVLQAYFRSQFYH